MRNRIMDIRDKNWQVIFEKNLSGSDNSVKVGEIFDMSNHFSIIPSKKVTFVVLLVTISVMSVFITTVRAGSLSPLTTPAATSYTLTDIYNRLSTNASATAGSHAFTPPGAPTGSLHTLTQIYDAIPAIDATKVFSGTTYLGVDGTLNLACNTATFDGTANKVADGYDGAGNGTNRFCMTDSGDAVAGNILSGKVAWVDGLAVTGTMPTQTLSTGSQTLSAGYYSATTLSTVDSDFSAPNIANGVNIFGVTGTGLIAEGNASANSVLETATFSSSTAVNVTGTIPVKTGNTVVASSSAQSTSLVLTVPNGYYSGSDSITVSTSSAGLLASNILGTANIFGVAGTFLKNLWNGTRTDGGFDGGSQTNGGVDDYNNARPAASNRYTSPAGWTQCVSSAYDAVTNPGGNYCNTGEAGADAMDNATGFVWSMPCNGAGCDSFSDASPMVYAWATTTYANNFSTIQNDYATISILCSGGDHGRTGWTIPHQKQLMQAYIDGSYGNLEASGVNRYYWSGTTVSFNTANAWLTYLSLGYTYYGNKLTNPNYVRCVRPGP